jgi:hypothetical protein
VLAFPLQGDTAFVIGACALARLPSYWLGSSLSVQWLPSFSVAGDSNSVFAVVLGLLLDLGILMLGLKVAVEALLDTAHDRLGSAGAGGLLVTDSHALGQIFLLLIFLVPLYLVALWFGGVAAFAVLATGALVLPAAIMLQAVDENLWHALDPRAWWDVFRRLGGAYLGAVLQLSTLAAAAIALDWLLWSRLPPWLGTVGGTATALYALVVGYHLLGRLILAHHARLGFDVTPPIVRPMLGNAEEDETMLAAERLLAEDGPAPAAACLRALIERRGASAPIHDRYRQWLLASNDLPRLAEHARQQVAAWLALGQPKRALALLLESRTLDPAFQLEDPETIATVVTQAAAIGHSQLAVELAAGFESRFPKSPDLPRTVLTAARLLAERFGRDQEARDRLEAVAQRYPEHPLAAEIAALLAALPDARDAPRA